MPVAVTEKLTDVAAQIDCETGWVVIAGGVLTVTVLAQVLVQLLVPVMFRVKVNEPPPAGSTMTD